MDDKAWLIGLTVATTQAVKRIYRAITGNELGDLSIVVAIALGVCYSILHALKEGLFHGGGAIDAVFAGITIGLTACGLYSLVREFTR